MAGSEATWMRKLFFWYVSMAAAGGLILFSVHLAVTGKTPDFGSMVRESASQLSQGMGHGLYTITHAVGSVPRLAADAADVKAFIRPSGHATHVPVITTSSVTVATIKVPPVKEKPKPVTWTPGSVTAAATVLSPSGGNTYTWGNCTWWVAARRAQIKDPIPGFWGDAASWAVHAVRDGYVVDHHPTPGAIMQTPSGLGHVAFVERVEQNGTWHISEMNAVGLDVVDYQTRSPVAAANYNFIHDRR